MNENEYTSRLDRIENKIDKLSNAMVDLARAEERILNIEAERADLNMRFNTLAYKVEKQDKRIIANEITLGQVRRGTWLILSTMCLLLLTKLFETLLTQGILG